MSSETMTANSLAGGDSFGSVRGWVIFAGITSLVVGTAAVIYRIASITPSATDTMPDATLQPQLGSGSAIEPNVLASPATMK
jgi:hypothetical protein